MFDWIPSGDCHECRHPDPDLRRELGHVFAALHHIIGKVNKIMATVDDLVTDVAAQKTVIDSLDTVLANIAQLIADLKTNQTDPATAAKIDQLSTDVRSNTARVAADVVANTPAA